MVPMLRKNHLIILSIGRFSIMDYYLLITTVDNNFNKNHPKKTLKSVS